MALACAVTRAVAVLMVVLRPFVPQVLAKQFD